MNRMLLAAAAALVATDARAQAAPPAAAPAPSAADTAGIRAAALDYIEGWYAGDAARMERALHPELAKRIVNTNPNGRSVLGQQGALTLINGTRAGGGKENPVAIKPGDVRVLDIYRGAASARVEAGTWIDYLHLARWNGRWVIVNVLWELKPGG